MNFESMPPVEVQEMPVDKLPEEQVVLMGNQKEGVDNAYVESVEDSKMTRRDFLKFTGKTMLAVGFSGVLTAELEAGDKELNEMIERDGLTKEKLSSIDSLRDEMWKLAMESEVEHMTFAVRKGEQYYKVEPKIDATHKYIEVLQSRVDPFLGKNIKDFEEVRCFHTHPYETVLKYGRKNEINVSPAQPSIPDLRQLVASSEKLIYDNKNDNISEFPLYYDVISPKYNWSMKPDFTNEKFKELCQSRSDMLKPARQKVEAMSDKVVLREFLKFNSLPDFQISNKEVLGAKHFMVDMRNELMYEFSRMNKESELQDIQSKAQEKNDKITDSEVMHVINTNPVFLADMQNEMYLHGVSKIAAARAVLLQEEMNALGYAEISEKYKIVIQGDLLDILSSISREMWTNTDLGREQELIDKYVNEMRKIGIIVTYKKNDKFEKYVTDKKRQKVLDKISGMGGLDDEL